MHALSRRAVDGAAMSTGLDRIEPAGFARIGHRFLHWSEKNGAGYLEPRHVLPYLLLSAAVLVVGVGAWLLLPDDRGRIAEGKPVQVVAAAPQAAPNEELPFNPATAEAIAPAPPAPLDKIMISSQSWRRGGLGSNALVTFTLRNNNAYAVKDIQIACAFARRDGSHLTDRSRVIPDTVNMKSRKTFVRMHIGFVNVNASRAKCVPIAANRV
jgi:hypothetical protein